MVSLYISLVGFVFYTVFFVGHLQTNSSEVACRVVLPGYVSCFVNPSNCIHIYIYMDIDISDNIDR